MPSRDILALMAAATLLPTLAGAQSQGVRKTTLQTQPFPGPVYHTVTVRALLDRGGVVGWHTHPGIEMGYVVQGRATLKVQGRADQPLAAGGSFAIPTGTVHSLANAGPGPLVVISTYVVDQSKPILSPAPAPVSAAGS